MSLGRVSELFKNAPEHLKRFLSLTYGGNNISPVSAMTVTVYIFN